MPTYEYKCEECDHVTSRTSKISERDEPCSCEECGSEKTVKGFYSGETALVQFKGTGWVPNHLSEKTQRELRNRK